jgi:hypothetical protein
MPQVPIWCPFGELDLCDKLRLYHTQFFISSLVKTHCVRVFSGTAAGTSRPGRMKEGSMKLRIAYNQHSEILAVTEGGSQADQIVAPPGVTVAELDVPTKF